MKGLFVLYIIGTLVPLFCGCSSNVAVHNSVTFGVVTDVQYADCMPAGSRHYRSSLSKIDESVCFFNENCPDFVVNLGDLTDRSPDEIDAPLSRLNMLHAPLYHLLGNHDFKGGVTSQWLVKQLNMPSTYYTISKGDWIFVFLDTNELALYSHPSGQKQQELQELLSLLDEQKAEQKENWNGGVSRCQLQWLDSLLHQSEEKNKHVALFSHHPFYPQSRFSALNNADVLKVIGRYTCVKVAFAGHHHEGASGYYKGIPFITLEGMVETRDSNAYGLVKMFGDSVVLEGKGRMRSYKLKCAE